MSIFDLTGRKALVTGGARGLGAGMASALAKAGAAVMIGDVLVDVGHATAKALAVRGAKAGFVMLDVTDDASWEKAVAATISELGGFDILINNAGIEITSLAINVVAGDLRRMTIIQRTSAIRTRSSKAAGLLPANSPFHLSSRAQRLNPLARLDRGRRHLPR